MIYYGDLQRWFIMMIYDDVLKEWFMTIFITIWYIIYLQKQFSKTENKE